MFIIIFGLRIIILLFCYLYLLITLKYYSRNENKILTYLDDLCVDNDKLEQTNKLILLSFKMCKFIKIIFTILGLVLLFQFVYSIITLNEFYVIFYFYIFYYPISAVTTVLLLIMIIITISLYFENKKEYFKKYLNFSIKFAVLSFLLRSTLLIFDLIFNISNLILS